MIIILIQRFSIYLTVVRYCWKLLYELFHHLERVFNDKLFLAVFHLRP